MYRTASVNSLSMDKTKTVSLIEFICYRPLEVAGNSDSTVQAGEGSLYFKVCVRTGQAWTGQMAPNYFLSYPLFKHFPPTPALDSPFPIFVHVRLPSEGNLGTGVRCKMTREGKNGPRSSTSLEVQSPLRNVAVISLGMFVHCPCFQLQVELLGHGQPLTWASSKPNGITVELPHLSFHQMPCRWGWTLALTNVT